MCKCVLPPGVNPIAVDKYIKVSKEIVHHFTDFLPSSWVATSESSLVTSRRKTNNLNLISKAIKTGKVEFHATGNKANKF
jgi:hypothetical protein